MTASPIAPYQPYLRTLSLCHPHFKGRYIEYQTFTDEIHLLAEGRSAAKDIIDALATCWDRPIWVELVHYPGDDHNQISATFWSMESLLVDVAKPTPTIIEAVLIEIGASDVAQAAIAAAFAEKNVIVYFDQGWKYYVVPAADENTEEAA
ncbi:MAG TPA: hypothetical protein PKD28_01440 [Candidatus Saccharibacteria bacterium]|nr:hypothetical protein [Candidatus Saccharibacteria bacterium]